jgi:hypothetical protein
MSEPVVLINVFEVPVADAEQFVAAWEKTRDSVSCGDGASNRPSPRYLGLE